MPGTRFCHSSIFTATSVENAFFRQMTEILFYTQVEDKMRTACQLSAKALSRSMRVMILTSSAEVTERLSRMLWSAPSIGFFPHCRASDRLAPRTPIIVDHATDPLIHDEVLINLCDEMPEFFSRFQRVIEIVSTDATDRDAARARFRYYRDRGYEIRIHQLADTKG